MRSTTGGQWSHDANMILYVLPMMYDYVVREIRTDLKTTYLEGHNQMSRLDVKAKLEEAINEYVREVHGTDTIVATDYILTVAAVDYQIPAIATFYFHEGSGAIHSLAGLAFMRDEEIKMLNREEATSSNE